MYKYVYQSIIYNNEKLETMYLLNNKRMVNWLYIAVKKGSQQNDNFQIDIINWEML